MSPGPICPGLTAGRRPWGVNGLGQGDGRGRRRDQATGVSVPGPPTVLDMSEHAPTRDTDTPILRTAEPALLQTHPGGHREYTETAPDPVVRIQELHTAGLYSSKIATLPPCMHDTDGAPTTADDHPAQEPTRNVNTSTA